MKARIRIYRVHDYDLMLYYFGKKDETITFSGLVKKVIRNCINGEPIVIPHLLKTENRNFPYKLETTVNFKEDVDADIISYLSSIVPRQRNGFLKNLLRQGMEKADFVTCYMVKDVLQHFERKKSEVIPSSEIISKRTKTKEVKKDDVKRAITTQNEVTEKSILETTLEPVNNAEFDLFGAFEKMIER